MPKRKEKPAPTLVRRDNSPLGLLRQEFSTLFDRVFGGWPLPYEPLWDETTAWAFEMDDVGSEVVIRAELPGFAANEVAVELSGTTLTIKAEHKEEKKEVKEKEIEEVEEKRSSKVFRSVTLPEGVDGEHIEATYRNGVLELHMPKLPGAMPRRIDVKT